MHSKARRARTALAAIGVALIVVALGAGWVTIYTDAGVACGTFSDPDLSAATEADRLARPASLLAPEVTVNRDACRVVVADTQSLRTALTLSILAGVGMLFATWVLWLATRQRAGTS